MNKSFSPKFKSSFLLLQIGQFLFFVFVLLPLIGFDLPTVFLFGLLASLWLLFLLLFRQSSVLVDVDGVVTVSQFGRKTRLGSLANLTYSKPRSELMNFGPYLEGQDGSAQAISLAGMPFLEASVARSFVSELMEAQRLEPPASDR